MGIQICFHILLYFLHILYPLLISMLYLSHVLFLLYILHIPYFIVCSILYFILNSILYTFRHSFLNSTLDMVLDCHDGPMKDISLWCRVKYSIEYLNDAILPFYKNTLPEGI